MVTFITTVIIAIINKLSINITIIPIIIKIKIIIIANTLILVQRDIACGMPSGRR